MSELSPKPAIASGGLPPPAAAAASTAFDPAHVSLLWAGPERAGEISLLHGQLFQPAWTEAAIAQLLEHPAATAFVAHLASRQATTGFIIGRLVEDSAEIITTGVGTAYARHGIGRRLVEGFNRAVKKAEGKRVFLEVAGDNASAFALYRGLGFQEVARRKGYYEREGGSAVDALVMTLAV